MQVLVSLSNRKIEYMNFKKYTWRMSSVIEHVVCTRNISDISGDKPRLHVQGLLRICRKIDPGNPYISPCANERFGMTIFVLDRARLTRTTLRNFIIMKLIIICSIQESDTLASRDAKRKYNHDVIGLSCRREWYFDSQCQDYKSQETRYSCFDNDIGELITSRQPVSRFAATVLVPFTIHVPRIYEF